MELHLIFVQSVLFSYNSNYLIVLIVVVFFFFFLRLLKISSQSTAFDSYFNFIIRRIYLFNTIAKCIIMRIYIYVHS